MTPALRIAVDAETETDRVAHFASHELRDHLARLTGASVVIVPPPTDGTAAIRLVVDEDLLGRADLTGDPVHDDAIAIEVHGADGIIAGRNPRSLLIAVYRYLRELGFRWLRPGADGEHHPVLSVSDFAATTVRVVEQASLRHRGICIEGSTSLSEVINLVDWMPKVGMNAYFVQFLDGAPFFRTWYTGPDGNPAYSPAAAGRSRDRVVAALQDRGLVFHAVGHGWTTAAIGLTSTGWDTVELGDTAPLAPLALVNGERQLWKGVPANTELCYSDPVARDRFTTVVLDYAREHPEVDLLHLWLSDGTGNHCECAACTVRLPSEWYVTLLNEIDAALTSAGLPVRLVALAYHQLLWAPREGAFTNPDRFCYMFAPISRDYRTSLPATVSTTPMPPYPGNDYPPMGMAELLASQRDWRTFFSGDSFVFDYHFMWQHAFDPGLVQLAGIIADDVRHYAALGLGGLISCQSQRTFLPDGSTLSLLAQLLWDSGSDASALVAEHRTLEYGAAVDVVVAHLERLSELAVAAGLNTRHPADVLDHVDVLDELTAELTRFLASGAPAGLRPGAWPALEFQAEFWVRLVAAVRAAATGGDPSGALADLTGYGLAAPPQVQSQFDPRNVLATVENYLRAVRAAVTAAPAAVE